jgi:SAM-dependent methyltransferase
MPLHPDSVFGALRAGYGSPEAARHFALRSGEGFSEDERSIADRYVAPEASLLLAGGGGGRDARAWVLRGNRVTVVDLAPKMAALARDATASVDGTAGRFVAANAVSLPFRRAAFDHVLFGDSVYDNIPGRARRQQALREAAPLVRGGFLFVHCAWIGASPRVPAGDFFQKLRVARQWLNGNLSAREPGDARIRLLVPDGSRRSLFRHFFRSPEEIRDELAGTGLEIEDRMGGIWLLRPAR